MLDMESHNTTMPELTEADKEFETYYNTPFSIWTSLFYMAMLFVSFLFFGTLRRLRGDV